MAQLGEIATFDGVFAFPRECASELEAFAPQVIVAAADELVSAAHAIFCGDLALESVDSALFALIQIGGVPVAPAERDLIWRAFQVPLYELYVDSESNLLAAECEAHDGWHLRSLNVEFFLEGGELFLRQPAQAKPIRTGLTATCTDGRCECGDAAPLVRAVSAHFSSVAASAS
jgi:hypothetical protein